MAKKRVEENIATAICMEEYKVIIIGALGVGKTSLLLRYVHNTFEDRVSKFISEERKTIMANNKEIGLHLWDTAGQERFQSITNRFYSDTHAVVIVYDISSDDALNDVNFWVREIQYYLPQELERGLPVLIVGNKRDLVKKDDADQKRANFRQAQEIAHSQGFLPPVQCSAKTGENVQKVFQVVADDLAINRVSNPPIVRRVSTKTCLCSSN